MLLFGADLPRFVVTTQGVRSALRVVCAGCLPRNQIECEASMEPVLEVHGLDARALPPPFEIKTAHDEQAFLIALYGEVDVANVHVLRAASRRAERYATPEVVVDLSALTYMDSTGLSVLLALHTRCQEQGRTLRLLPGPPQVQRIFQICGLLERLNFHD
jgi:anti-anti-sigma factor